MKYELSELDVEFLQTAIDKIVVSLDSEENKEISNLAKLHILGECYRLQQILSNPEEESD